MASATMELLEASFYAAIMRILRSRSFSILIVRLTLVEAGCFPNSLVFATEGSLGFDSTRPHVKLCCTIINAAHIIVQHDFMCRERKDVHRHTNFRIISYLGYGVEVFDVGL